MLEIFEHLGIIEKLTDPLQLVVFTLIVLSIVYSRHVVKMKMLEIEKTTNERVRKRNQQISALKREMKLTKERVVKLEKSQNNTIT